LTWLVDCCVPVIDLVGDLTLLLYYDCYWLFDYSCLEFMTCVVVPLLLPVIVILTLRPCWTEPIVVVGRIACCSQPCCVRGLPLQPRCKLELRVPFTFPLRCRCNILLLLLPDLLLFIVVSYWVVIVVVEFIAHLHVC